LLFAVFAMIVVLFSFIIFLHGKYNIVDISLTFFGVFYITFLLSFIVLTRNLKSGFLLSGSYLSELFPPTPWHIFQAFFRKAQAYAGHKS